MRLLERTREIKGAGDWLEAFQGATASERTALMLGKRIEGLDLVLMERADNLAIMEVSKLWERRKELYSFWLDPLAYNPSPCTPRTPHPPTKEQILKPSAKFSFLTYS